MLNIAKTESLQLFNHGILTTFGKLDALDIASLDGCPDQLVALLQSKYEWSCSVAQHKVDLFLTQVSNCSQ